MVTALGIAYVIQFLGLAAVVALAGVLVVSTVGELLRRRARESGAAGSASLQEPLRGAL